MAQCVFCFGALGGIDVICINCELEWFSIECRKSLFSELLSFMITSLSDWFKVLARAHFSALCVGCVQLLPVLIGLTDCLHPF